jgi:hypothetical protein
MSGLAGIGAAFSGLSIGRKALALGGAVLLIAGLCFALFKIVTHGQDARVGEAREAGATEAVAAGQGRTLDQLGDANDAQRNLRNHGERSAARYDQCLLDSRGPAACERYRPLAD